MSILIIQIAELADNLHPDCFLRLDEFALEEINQYVTLSGKECVLPEFDDGAAGLHDS